ncbi:hypothetical protein GQ44DRAFT_699215 [Phaeosphaeriaceae sp. PMI808]|nr:hypothetical protein GQ44DRAFT_699215 [Phaeosphaeriaceae sp. PMI808]
MDPYRNLALYNAKSQSILQSQTTSRPTGETDDMPAPPAYHMVVDPNAPISNVHSSYDAEDGLDKEDDETPEITLNAATQVRGNGNIISIAQMDSVRLANLISTILNGGKVIEPISPTQSQTQTQTQSGPQPQIQQGLNLPSLASLTSAQLSRPHTRINITVNCGATVIGDRNIVGPGLGDIARQMQVAQRNQALHAQQQQQAAQNQRTSPTVPNRETLYQAQAPIAHHHALFDTQPSTPPTPPMSRSSSWQSGGSGGTKRRADHDLNESTVKKQR